MIYLDLDQTLIDQFTDLKPKLRPGAKEFIRKLQNLSPVVILTHGETLRQTGIAEELGIDLKVIGRDEYDTVRTSPNAILIDDHTKRNAEARKKLRAIGIKPDRLVHIKAWHVGDKEDGFQKAYAKVKEILYPKKDEAYSFRNYLHFRE